MSARSYTSNEWLAVARHVDGSWQRDADGYDVRVTVQAGEPWRIYALVGPNVGSITVEGAGNGDAWRDGEGDGLELDTRGTRSRVEAPEITYPCAVGDGWLRIGCELHSFATWIANADEIDALHVTGIAELTRALAQRCIVAAGAEIDADAGAERAR